MPHPPTTGSPMPILGDDGELHADPQYATKLPISEWRRLNMPNDIHATALAAVADATARPKLDATQALIDERGRTHGDFKDHANYAQLLKYVMQGAENWTFLNVVQKESLEMIAHKIGRILAGDPDFRDHWEDIAGYARLVAERCGK